MAIIVPSEKKKSPSGSGINRGQRGGHYDNVSKEDPMCLSKDTLDILKENSCCQFCDVWGT